MCDELGVMSPKEPEYMALFPVIVNSPQDGIVVVGEDEFMEEITHDDMTLKVRRKRKKNGDTTE